MLIENTHYDSHHSLSFWPIDTAYILKSTVLAVLCSCDVTLDN